MLYIVNICYRLSVTCRHNHSIHSQPPTEKYLNTAWKQKFDHVELGSPNFFSLRATLTPPLSPKGQDLASSSYQHSVVLNYVHIFVLGLARGFFSAFGTTYMCEKTFSKMKYTKNIYRSKLTDEHLKSLLIISTSKLDPQLQAIVSGKLQLHKSH
jgi:hypothetical protein